MIIHGKKVDDELESNKKEKRVDRRKKNVFGLQEEDSKYFAYKDVNKTHVSVVLGQSLEDLVDADAPRNLLKFRLSCDYSDGSSNSLVKYTHIQASMALILIKSSESCSGSKSAQSNERHARARGSSRYRVKLTLCSSRYCGLAERARALFRRYQHAMPRARSLALRERGCDCG